MMKEQLSALMDSELSDNNVTRLIKSLKTDQALHETWDTYHLLGDVLRKSPQLSDAFNVQLAQRLAQEPTILAPWRERLTPSIRRFPVAIAASVAAVSLVGILALQVGRLNQNALPPPIAATPAATSQQLALAPAQSPMQPITANKALAIKPVPTLVQFNNATPHTYLLAHQEYSPSYAPAYVRVVTEQMDANR